MEEPKPVIACPFCGAPTEVEYASTGTSVECIGDDGCHAMIVMPCFPHEAERLIRAGAGGALNYNRGKRFAPASWLDALATELRAEAERRITVARKDDAPERVIDATIAASLSVIGQCVERTLKSASNGADMLHRKDPKE